MLRSRARFGIGFLFFVTMCIAGYFAAYKFGLDEIRAKWDRAVSVRTYDVSDLVAPGNTASVGSGLSELQKLIVSTINGDWDRSEFRVDPFLGNRSLVITQTGACHRDIQKLLDDLRALVKNRR